MVDYKECLFYNAPPEIHKRAKELRKNMTDTEKILWEYIRNRRFKGLKFRRQHPIDIFIADFYCHELKLIIELDGKIHNTSENQEYDEGRTAELRYLGVQVIRFTNEEIDCDIKGALRRLEEFINNMDSL
ncbi:endonuclease domain-containing protein [Marinifilum flexuosum]|uniref:Very-short-patch-repair endonuclease n=1 Tax=Marinifilum flexuosum TaxID=1117708 RepID=A0A419X9Q9_9BACT|nr:endonuclease domain-containing protein [Marinifilum flexuosum]RKE04289.1 very-short-patch-repair endonuclease [Marinifilum flexuosum]